MRSKLLFCVVLGLATAAYAKDPKAYQSGKLLQMDSVSCGTSEKEAKSNKKTQELLCQQYVLQGENVNYLIRPRDEKHPALLSVGMQAEFRIEKDKMKVRMADSSKELEFNVVSMTPRTDSTSADTAAQPNHLQ